MRLAAREPGGTAETDVKDEGPGRGRLRQPARIRDVAGPDLEAVLALNEQAVPAVNSLTLDRLRWFAREAAYFRVAAAAGRLAGFLICLPPEADYASPNFRWLSARYADFLYIDRIAVAPEFHRRGVAGALYRDAAASASSRYRRLACEVNTRPRNDASLAFHERFGFRAVGSQDHGSVRVRYFVRPLPL